MAFYRGKSIKSNLHYEKWKFFTSFSVVSTFLISPSRWSLFAKLIYKNLECADWIWSLSGGFYKWRIQKTLRLLIKLFTQ